MGGHSKEKEAGMLDSQALLFGLSFCAHFLFWLHLRPGGRAEYWLGGLQPCRRIPAFTRMDLVLRVGYFKKKADVFPDSRPPKGSIFWINRFWKFLFVYCETSIH